MSPRRKSPEPVVVRVKRCWGCDGYHEFRRGNTMGKILPKDKKVNLDLYGWIGLDYPSGMSVYIEDFDTLDENDYKFP